MSRCTPRTRPSNCFTRSTSISLDAEEPKVLPRALSFARSLRSRRLLTPSGCVPRPRMSGARPHERYYARPVRILLWHGYLLEGTGSNIYTRAIAREWSRAGHEVVVFCQDPSPQRFDLAGADVVRPEIGGRLPTFVIDRYEGLEPVL